MIRRLLFWWRMRQVNKMYEKAESWRRPARRRELRMKRKLFKRWMRRFGYGK